ncbi:MAG: bifunctional adenosylcobinamide kinase/adenosylcobinamide-phosphate guanylyltransferase [Firmicutes bacterium]|nr:bifunctional adenosylcobinamide kinase/adenosylcobinamide-phosphate guanylyltransferase [Bacillota bacterium]
MILITGGARSGKSRYAEKLARQSGKDVIYVATAAAGDAEMQERISRHRARRPASWQTWEEPHSPGPRLAAADRPERLFLVDCLTLLVSNHLLRALQRALPPGDPLEDLPAALAGPASEAVYGEMEALAALLRNLRATVLVVTNEVGQGVVPERPLGRAFRDLAGRVNQAFAAAADQVYVMFCGLPLQLKGKP